ncbi:MAG: hypothetical protein FWF46_05590 [Oscillospiraceae bacterium]|nr:hypothetical protein [Oscillospiraceae bacterium]
MNKKSKNFMYAMAISGSIWIFPIGISTITSDWFTDLPYIKNTEMLNLYLKESKNAGIIHEYSKEERDSLYNDAADIISKKYGRVIEKQEILNRLNEKGSAYYADVAKFAGYYRNSNIFLAEFCYEIVKKNTLHEIIHKIQFSKGFIIKDYIEMPGFIEGATESMAIDAFSDRQRSRDEINSINSNLTNSTMYGYEVLIVRQMGALLGDSKLLEEFTLNGDKSFLNEFEKQYGKDLLKKLISFTNFAYEFKDERHPEQKFEEIQNLLLQEAFDKKFEVACHGDEASLTAYLTELNDFKSVRGEIEGGIFNKNYKGDYYKDYYNGKLSKIAKIFDERKYNKKILKDFDYNKKEAERSIEFTAMVTVMTMEEPISNLEEQKNIERIKNGNYPKEQIPQILLKELFDNKFKSIKNEIDAMSKFKDLINHRGIVGKEAYKEYYINQFSKVEELFKKKGYNLNALKYFQYDRVEEVLKHPADEDADVPYTQGTDSKYKLQNQMFEFRKKSIKERITEVSSKVIDFFKNLTNKTPKLDSPKTSELLNSPKKEGKIWDFATSIKVDGKTLGQNPYIEERTFKTNQSNVQENSDNDRG